MSCLKNMDSVRVQLFEIKTITELYKFKGKDFYYQDILKRDLNSIIKENIEHECINISKMLNLDITDNRLKLVVKKGSNPKNKNEAMLRNAKFILETFTDRVSNFDLMANQFLFMGKKLFEDVKEIEFKKFDIIEAENLINFKKKVSKREILEGIINEYKMHLRNGIYENISLAVSFYIDFLMNDIFTSDNEYIGLFILYALIYREGFDMFKYSSFFEIYLKNEEEFKLCKLKAMKNWEEGFSDINPLVSLVMKILIEGYRAIDQKIKAQEITSKNNKTDLVEYTILKRMPQTFTKQMIQELHPNISSETIDRTLKRLRIEDKIRPNGTGRSASWNRIVEIEKFNPNTKQISLFDLDDELDN